MWQLVLESILLGVGLAMDACAVSMANGLNEPKMKVSKNLLIAILFGFFQALMPMIGWVCVHFVAQQFEIFNKAVPYIALALLGFIGGKMIFEGVKEGKEAKNAESVEEPVATVVKKLTFGVLIVQAIATSIDALSVGFTIADKTLVEALISATIIAVVTFVISFVAVIIGKKFGNKLGNKAEILGGIILIAIGLEIFITGVFF